MGTKRKKNEGSAIDDAEDTPKAKKTRTEEKKEALRPSMIKNKEKRSEVHAKLKQLKKLEKRAKTKARAAAVKRALELGEEVPLHSPFSENIFELALLFVSLLLMFIFWCGVFFAASREEGPSYHREH